MGEAGREQVVWGRAENRCGFPRTVPASRQGNPNDWGSIGETPRRVLLAWQEALPRVGLGEYRRSTRGDAPCGAFYTVAPCAGYKVRGKPSRFARLQSEGFGLLWA